MKVIGIHQPHYLPWLGLIDRVSRCDLFVVLDNVPYSKNYFYNRNKIKTANGPVWLSVPVLTKGQFEQTFVETAIDNKQDWAKKHWKSIYYSYSKAPYFSEYGEFFQRALEREWQGLTGLCMEAFCYLLKSFHVETPILSASDMNVTGKKEALVLNICREAGATHYLSGPDGANYLNLDLWKEAGIHVDFQDYNHPTYPQLFGEFTSHLSCIDLLFNCGGNDGRTILNAEQKTYFEGQR